MNRQCPPSPSRAALTTNSELAGCVKAWRHRLGEESRAHGECRRQRGSVTQQEIAEAVGVSVVWYGNLERGVRANYSVEFLDAVARELKLNTDERELLHLLAVERRPPPSPSADAAASVPDGGLRQVVSAQRWPTYVLDRCSRIVLHNEPCESYYPWLRHDSCYPRWVLASADARQRLVRWENDWAAPLLAQLRMARAQHPRDTRIASLIDTCLSASADVRRLWDAHADRMSPPRSRRSIRLPDDRHATTVDVVTLADPMPGELRVVMLIPAADPP
jgi:transcriptional regulator with XRE-family HTH domain